MDVIIMSTSDFSYNPFTLHVGTTKSAVSILGFTTSSIAFNHNYYCDTTVKRRNNAPLDPLLNQRVYITWPDDQGKKRYLHGVVSKIIDNRQPGVLPDKLFLQSPLNSLDLLPYNAVYTAMNLTQLISTVLAQFGWQQSIDYQCKFEKVYPIRQYIVQYQESALAFLQRHCAIWGVSFAFIQQEHRPLLIFCDDIRQFSQQLLSAEITITTFEINRKVLAKTLCLNDYNPDDPSQSLIMKKNSELDISSIGMNYFPYEHYHDTNEGQCLLQNRLQFLDCQREVITAHSNNILIALGQRIRISDDRLAPYLSDFYIIEIKHHAEVNSLPTPHNHYVVLTLLRVTISFRPSPPKFFIMPDCLAVVTSDHVDEQGRYFIWPTFVEQQGQNYYPVRLSQPNVGNRAGFHYPLQKGTTVLLSHINGDPDRPVIMGVITDKTSVNPVTAINNFQHIIQTSAGNQMAFDDRDNKQSISVISKDQQIAVILNAAQGAQQITLFSQQDVALRARKDISQNTCADFIQTVTQTHFLTINALHQIITQKGDITFEGGKDLTMIVGNMLRLSCQQTLTLAAQMTIQMQAKALFNINASQLNFNANQHTISLGASNHLDLKSRGKIIISQGNSSIVLDDNYVTINAKQVNFNTPQFIATKIQLSAVNKNNLEQSGKQTNVQLNFQDEFGQALTNDALLGAYNLLDLHGNVIWAGGLLAELPHYNIDQTLLTLSHPSTAVVAVNMKLQQPSNHYSLPQTEVTPVNDYEVQHIRLQTIHLPVYKIISPVSSGSYEHVCQLLNSDEIKYFQQNGNNVTIFIHGYNVADGQFPGSEVLCDASGKLTTLGNAWYFNRTIQDIQLCLQGKISPEILQGLLQNSSVQNDNFDVPINGGGAHNWLLHMEYNLNCAAAGQYPFPWEQQALKYTRMIFVRWAGDVGNTTFNKALNFGGAELNALAAANALKALIQQLMQAGLTINVIAHSLGNLVLIKLLDDFGRQRQTPFDEIIMWQPAIASTALSSEISTAVETRIENISTNTLSVAGDIALVGMNRTATLTSALMSAGLSLYGDYLKLQAARINDPDHICSLDELYDKDPFAYFPYAYKAAKHINVLYSANDDILKYAYQSQDVMANISQWGFIHEPMGLIGPDRKTLIDLKNNLTANNQNDLLQSHSAMRIPSMDLFNQIYKKVVINKTSGIKTFGRYHLS
jgi:type VI secretion system secreted protein VgrG